LTVSGDPDVLVLGAGIQGSCVALALARAGRRVRIVDAADDCMSRASLRNEGKIHLGLVYANDPTECTPSLMLHAAFRFSELLDRWCGRPLPWSALRSRPFTYVVRCDSMCSPEALFERYDKLQAEFEGFDDAEYVGTTPERLWRPSSRGLEECSLDPALVATAVETAEVAVDTAALASEVRTAMHAHPMIDARYQHTVHGARRTAGGFVVDGTRADGSVWRAAAPVVVNCLWEQRIGIDAQLGIMAEHPWVLRLKYRVLGRLPAALQALPSMTFVLGRFGDIVVHPGRPTYLSWYPSCLAGWERESAPVEWQLPCAGHDARPDAAARAAAAVAALAEMVPGLTGFEVQTIDAGIIAAWGATDIDDPASVLHERHEIGVHAHDGWFSIDTGKLTTAPLFAHQLVDLVGVR
jgi:glycine/D-amino acid oxidase-like deaminating enzyme